MNRAEGLTKAFLASTLASSIGAACVLSTSNFCPIGVREGEGEPRRA